MAYKVIPGVTPKSWIGLSTDTKPTEPLVGSTVYDTDNGTEWIFDGSDWVVKRVLSITIPTTIDLQQVAGDYDLYTATGGTVYIVGFRITLPNVDCSDDVNITSISVQSDMTTVNIVLSAADGAKANLTALASFIYSGSPFALTTGKKIQLTIAGGAADAATVCTVSCRYLAVTPAAYLV